MKKYLLLMLLAFLSVGALYSQDSTEIYFQPEKSGDYTKFMFSFENKNQSSVKFIRLEILTDGVSFDGGAVSGDATAKGFGILDSLFVIWYQGDATFKNGEIAGDFHFNLTGDDAYTSIQWHTYDSLHTELKTGISKLPYTKKDTCYAISRTASAKDAISIPTGYFLPASGATWEMWFYLNDPIPSNSIPGYSQILASVDGSPSPDGSMEAYLGFGHSGFAQDHLVFSVGGNLTHTVGVPMAGLSGWIHVAGTYKDGDKVAIYVCNEDHSVSLSDWKTIPTGNLSLPQGIEIANWDGNPAGTLGTPYFFEGKIDEIRFWKTARSRLEIINDMHTCDLVNSDLYAYYPVLISEAASIPSAFILHDQTTNGLNSSSTQGHGIDWTADFAPLDCCGDINSPCLCEDDSGDKNYEITVINLNDANNCCWRFELEIECDMLFANSMGIKFPAGITAISPPTEPTGWIVAPGLGGYVAKCPNTPGYMETGIYTFDVCFNSPTIPNPFPVEFQLLDYDTDNHYVEYCELLNETLECEECDCDSIELSTPVNTVSDVDECCHDVTMTVPCDLYPISDINFVRFTEENSYSFTVTTTNSPAWTPITGYTPPSQGYQVPGWPSNNLQMGSYDFTFCFDPGYKSKCREIYVEYLNWTDADTYTEICRDTISICCTPCPVIENPVTSCACPSGNEMEYEVCFDLIDDPGTGSLCLSIPGSEGTITSSNIVLDGSGTYCFTFMDNLPFSNVGDGINFDYCYSENGSCDQQSNTCCDREKFAIPDCCPDITPVIVECLDKDANDNQIYSFEFDVTNKWDCPVDLNFEVDCGTLASTLVTLAASGTQTVTLEYTNDGNSCTDVCLTSYINMGNDKICEQTDCFKLPLCDDCGCCDSTYFKIDTYNTNIQNNVNCVYTVDVMTYPGVFQVPSTPITPIPIKRVAAHLVYAEYIVECDGNSYTHPLTGYFEKVLTKSTLVTSNANGTSAWIGCGTGDSAPLLGANINSLPGVFGTFENYCRGNEMIWGDFDKCDYIELFYDSWIIYNLKFEHPCWWIKLQPLCQITNEYIRYDMRYYFTDSTCCTCDTLITSTFPIKTSRHKPIASIVMDDLHKGTITIFNNLDSPLKGLIINSKQEEFDIESISNSTTGEKYSKDPDGMFEIGLNNMLPEEYREFDLECQANSKYMFEIKGMIEYLAGPGILDSLYFPSPWDIIAKVPYDGEGDKMIVSEKPNDLNYETITLQLTNLNIYKKDIASIKLHSMDEKINFAAVGEPLRTDSSIVLSMVEYKGKTYVVNDVEKSQQFVADTLRANYWELAVGESIEPIVITYSYPEGASGEVWEIMFSTYNSDGIKLSEETVSIPMTSIIDGGVIKDTKLYNCFPNPTSENVSFQFETTKFVTNVSLILTNELGEEVSMIVDNQSMQNGKHLVVFNTTGLPSGAYYYTLKADGESQTKLLIINK